MKLMKAIEKATKAMKEMKQVKVTEKAVKLSSAAACRVSGSQRNHEVQLRGFGQWGDPSILQPPKRPQTSAHEDPRGADGDQKPEEGGAHDNYMLRGGGTQSFKKKQLQEARRKAQQQKPETKKEQLAAQPAEKKQQATKPAATTQAALPEELIQEHWDAPIRECDELRLDEDGVAIATAGQYEAKKKALASTRARCAVIVHPSVGTEGHLIT